MSMFPDGAASGSGRPTWADVDACLDAGLAKTTSDRGRTALRNVLEAVQVLRRDDAPITIEAVGRWCVHKHGSPTAQSIRNNARTVDVVRIAIAVQTADARPPAPGRSEETEVLEQIGASTLRARLEGWLAHRRALIVEVTNLRAAVRRIEAIAFLTRQMAEVDIDELEGLVAKVREVQTCGGGPGFTEEECAASRAFLDSGMATAGLAVDEASGELIDRVKRTVADSGLVSALRKIAGLKLG